jgi:hypothetical protein
MGIIWVSSGFKEGKGIAADEECRSAWVSLALVAQA